MAKIRLTCAKYVFELSDDVSRLSGNLEDQIAVLCEQDYSDLPRGWRCLIEILTRDLMSTQQELEKVSGQLLNLNKIIEELERRVAQTEKNP